MRGMGSSRIVLGALACVAMGLGAGTAEAQVLLPGVDPGPIPSANSGGFAQFEGEAVEADPVRVPETPEHPVHGAERQVEYPRRRIPDGHEHDPRPAWRDDHRLDLLPSRVRFDHVRLARAGSCRSASGSSGRSWPCWIRTPSFRWQRTSCRRARSTRAEIPFTDFSGGGYFYLDDQDRAVMPTSERHVLVIGQTDEPDFEVVEDYDLNGVVPSDDKVISALPDWKGRIWFITVDGVVGWISPGSGRSTPRTSARRSGTRSRSTRRAPSTSSPTPLSIACGRRRGRCAS